MINGQEYASEDVKIILPGKPLPENAVVAIDYMSKKTHENLYGMSADPIALGRGKNEYEGSVTVLQSVIEGMQATLLPGQNLTQLPPFPITVAYAPAGGIPTIDQLMFCRIAEVPKGMKSGDTHMEVKLPLVIGKINYNV